jgi:Domain of unknown function (DUF4386)
VSRFDAHPNGSKKENFMTSSPSIRRTEILVASLWLVTAIGAIAGAVLINPVINAPDYLASVFSKSVTITGGMLAWMVNDIGIVFIGLLMFPILKKHSESMALGYLSMRIFESLSQEFIKSGATNLASFQAIGSVLKQAESWFLNTLQLVFLGLGGVILTFMLYQTKLVPRFISVVGLLGYALLLPSAALSFFGLIDSTPGGPGTILAVPAAFFEIILMPVWLFSKGFNVGAMPLKPAKMETNELLSVA